MSIKPFRWILGSQGIKGKPGRGRSEPRGAEGGRSPFLPVAGLRRYFFLSCALQELVLRMSEMERKRPIILFFRLRVCY